MAEIVSLQSAVAELVSDGDVVALEGFTPLIPHAAGHELIRQGRRDLTSEGYHLLRWTRSGLTFWAVSDVNGADLDSLAGLFQDSG